MLATERLANALSDRYLIERELGQGGMATVYLARDIKHDRHVALKVLRPELGAVLGSERFLAEIRITARLNHPHILTLIDSGESGGFLWYVLPYVRGESLRDLLNREKQLGLDQSLAITRQVASALAFAHAHGVIHRDIKPENILLQEGEAMLADFGIALAVREAGGNRLTETGLSLGTPQYMSPEQATGDRALDARSDVYSLAAVLYEMLTGEPPVTGATAQAMIAKLMTERPTRIRTVRDTVPEGIDNAVAKALAKVPADRFVGAAEFASALDVGRPSGRAAAAPQTRRTVALVAGVAAVATAIAVVGTRSGGGVRIVQPDRVQLTSTGTAQVAGLSADGRRLAYSAKRCDAQGSCTFDVVVEDLGGAGTSTVLRGFGSIWDIEWSGDGRYLLVGGWEGLRGTWGAFSVPSLGGGTVRHLGLGGSVFVGASDTVMTGFFSAGDSVLVLRFITIGDGIVRDSTLLPRSAGELQEMYSLPGGRLAVVSYRSEGNRLLLMDRRSGVLDSLPLPRRANAEGPTPDGRFLVVGVTTAGALRDILAYRISPSRITARPDTVLRAFTGELRLAANGTAIQMTGPTTFEVWRMRRDNAWSMRFTQQRLAAGTAQISGLPSPDGRQVAFFRRVGQGQGSLIQLSVMPADSGPETPIGPPMDIQDWEWSSDGQAILAGIARGRDSVTVQSIDIRNGRGRVLAVLTRSEFGIIEAAGTGAFVIDDSGFRIRRVGLPGLPDTTFLFPEIRGRLLAADASPDGRSLIATSWDRNEDSIHVRRISLVDGRDSLLHVVYADGAVRPQWMPDGNFNISLRENANLVVWHRMPPGGGRLTRLGSPPRALVASFRMSDDGRTVIARVADERPDVYLIRNFADMLPR